MMKLKWTADASSLVLFLQVQQDYVSETARYILVAILLVLLKDVLPEKAHMFGQNQAMTLQSSDLSSPWCQLDFTCGHTLMN